MKPVQLFLKNPLKKSLCLIFGGVVIILGANMPIAIAADSAVIFMYHRFGEDTVPSTSIKLGQFEAHLAEIKAGPYTVLPVPEIVARLKEKKALPDRTIGITIDDAYQSFYREAWPRFKKAGLPVTVFVSTGSIGQRNYMTWDQIRELSKSSVTIGHHTVHHNHMPRQDAASNAAEIRDARKHFEKELGYAPTLFAYPYGEGSKALEHLAKSSDFAAAFGQHSGVAHTSSNFFYLPRFALSESYGDLERFKLGANALALPVTDITPIDSLIGEQNPPAIGFTFLPGYNVPKYVTCYVSRIGKAEVQRLADIRLEVRVKKSFIKGRTRLNCTARGKNNRWYWLGRQFFVR
jgi:peptidoglycan/xylan/chitin deacetylase (PgdA/CDA1 family)